jgi:rhodanese-related sulfurtransferase
MNFRTIIYLMTLLLTTQCASAAFAQEAAVDSNTYGFMLKTLLSHSVKEVGVPAAAADEDAVFLDARERVEYEVSHIEGAHWVGYDDFDLSRVEDIDKEAHLIVYCSVGYRSEKVTEQLLEAGFTDVSNMYGGVFEWKNQGHSLVNMDGEETNKVHAYSRSWGVWLKEGDKVYNK